MEPAKIEVERILAKLPDNATLEDIQYHIYVRQKIEVGIADIEAGRVLSQEEAEAQFAKWLEP